MWFVVQNYLQARETKKRLLKPKLTFIQLSHKDLLTLKDILITPIKQPPFWLMLLKQQKLNWSLELLVHFGVNNNYVIFHSPVVINLLLYQKFFIKDFHNKQFNSKIKSEIVFGFTTGRCGFKRSQRRTFLATDITMRTTIWFCKRMYKYLESIKIRFLGQSKYIKRHLLSFKRFSLGNRRVKIHSLVDVTPTPYNGVRRKGVGRKRYRYHKYTYRRFFKIMKANNLQTDDAEIFDLE